jgi:hypothetical protein
MAQVIMPQRREKEDALSTLIKGLGIASQVYGIRANMAQLDDYKARQEKADLEKQQSEDLASGRYNKNQQVQLSEKFDISNTQPTSGGYQQVADLESGSPLYLSLKKDSSPLVHHVRGSKGGKSGTYLVDAKSNREIGFYEGPEDGVKTRQIDTVDENGRPVRKIVEDKPGQTFPAFPKASPTSSKENDYFSKLPKPAQEEVKVLANKSATKFDIASQMDKELQNYKEAYEKGDKTQALKSGEGMLKLLNSAQGQDAVGAEESKRLGSLLQYQLFNFTGSGEFFGRDLEGFYQQVAAKSQALKESVAENKKRIDEIYSGGYFKEIPKRNETLGGFGSRNTAGQAIAAPPKQPEQKSLQEMDDAELDAELERLRSLKRGK